MTTAAAPQGISKTFYHYDEADRLIAETAPGNVPLVTYIWNGDVLTGLIVHQPTRTVYAVQTDHLGSPFQVRTLTGTVVWRWEPEAFGKTQPDDDADGDGTKLTLNLRFPGQYHDGETGLYYVWHRYYDPKTGRFISSDPIGLAGGLNTYTYGYNNPLRYTDPDGLDVRVVTSDRAAAKILMEAYAKLNRTKKGQGICRKLEQSSDVYEIRPIDRDAFYCPPGTMDPKCSGKTRAVFIDPYNNVKLPTTNGMQPASKPVVLGHELGHAIGYRDDGPDMMNNVNANENPIRQQLGLPPRTSYTVPEIQWVPGTK